MIFLNSFAVPPRLWATVPTTILPLPRAHSRAMCLAWSSRKRSKSHEQINVLKKVSHSDFKEEYIIF